MKPSHLAAASPHAGRGSKIAAVLRVTSGNFLEQFVFFLFGFYKCMPRNWCGRGIALPSLVIEINDVLVLMMPSTFARAPTSFRILSFSYEFSVAATMMKSELLSCAKSVVA